MEHHFFSYLYRLRHIQRWSLMRNTLSENVAEHSFHVSILTHALCTIGNEMFDRELPTEQLVTAALFHDSTEVFTGDIAAPIKHHNPKILHSFREIEQLAAKRMLNMIPEPLQAVYAPLLQSNPMKEEYYNYIKAADLLDAYLKCSAETTAGNREFSVAKEQILATIKKLGLPEVDYFLSCLAPSFERTLDELFSTTKDLDLP